MMLASLVNMRTSTARVFLLERDPERAAAVIAAIRAAGLEVEFCAEPLMALKLMRRSQCDAAIVPLQEIRERGAAWKMVTSVLLVCTPAEERVTMPALFAQGMRDFVIMSPETNWVDELVLRLQCHLFVTGEETSETVTIEDVILDRLARKATRDGLCVGLTATELDLLRCLVDHRGVVVPYQTMRDTVMRGNADAESLRSHVMNLRRKLGEAAATRVVTVRGVGFRLEQA